MLPFLVATTAPNFAYAHDHGSLNNLHMDRLTLERRQVWAYLSAIIAGLLAGSTWPGIDAFFEAMLWPTLMLLLYATFVQVPLLHLREAFRDHRFVTAALAGNFILLPALVWGLVQWLPPDPALRLGVLLVLLVPCTDWFITFSQLGGGNVSRAIALTPINLLLQLLLLPLYLWLMAGAELSAALDPRRGLARTRGRAAATGPGRYVGALDRGAGGTRGAARAAGVVAGAAAGAGGIPDRRRAGRRGARRAGPDAGHRASVRRFPVVRGADRQGTGPADAACPSTRDARSRSASAHATPSSCCPSR